MHLYSRVSRLGSFQAKRIVPPQWKTSNLNHISCFKAFSSSQSPFSINFSTKSGSRSLINSHHDDEDVYVPNPRRVWKPNKTSSPLQQQTWLRSVDSTDVSSMRDALNEIGIQEMSGGRMQERKLGVISQDPKEDMRLLIENYTVPALASGLRDREALLQTCAELLAEGNLDELGNVLRPYEPQYVKYRRQRGALDLTPGFTATNLETIRKGLNRMPRRVTQAHQKRAAVVLPLCNVNGVPCILFEKRSEGMRAHPSEVCLPGGMVSEGADSTIVETCLREMTEEIRGLKAKDTSVLGVLRCNWGEVHHLTGVAVTPVVCFIGEIGQMNLIPDEGEVSECFTVPLAFLLDRNRWVHRPDFAPVFTGGPHLIWGLTGYIIHRFLKDVMARYQPLIERKGW